MGSRTRSPPRIEGMVSLKVDNIAYRTTTEDLQRVFTRYGKVGDIYIPRNPFTYESRGFAFVRFYNSRDAEDAIRSMDCSMMDGREIRVQYAKYGRPSTPQRKRRYLSRSNSPRRTSRRSRSRSRRDRDRSRSRDKTSRDRRSRDKTSRDRRSRDKTSRDRSRDKSRDRRSRDKGSREKRSNGKTGRDRRSRDRNSRDFGRRDGRGAKSRSESRSRSR